MRRSERGSEKVALGVARKQREVIRDVMLSAGQCATWLTLEELAKLTQFPPASISAQLRHLRKPRFGGYQVAKRCRPLNKVMRAEGFGPVWEYSLEPVWRVLAKRTKRRKARSARPPEGAGKSRRVTEPARQLPARAVRRSRGDQSGRRRAWA